MTPARSPASVEVVVAQLRTALLDLPPDQHLTFIKAFVTNAPLGSDAERNAVIDLVIMGVRVGELNPKRRHFVILVHGIRTTAAWAGMIQDVLDRELGCETRPLRYGYFDVVRFALPGPWRGTPARQALRQLQNLRAEDRDADISIICHSFGTYTVCQLLKENPWLRIRRLILCGSIVPSSYDWSEVAHQLEPRVLNECGDNDVWPIMAALLTWGYGPTGSYGFGDVTYVCDRFHNTDHSGFFNRQFVESMWVPFLRDGSLPQTAWDQSRPTPSEFWSFLGSPLASFITKALVFLVIVSASWVVIR